MEDVKILEGFLPSFQAFELKLQKKFLFYDKGFIEVFLNEFEPVNDEIEISKHKHASEFNVFDIIRYGHYETRLHTPFLKNLLTPDGKHGQNQLFIESFLKKFVLPGISFENVKYFEIYEEMGIGDLGRIDIFIQFELNKAVYRIAIENKINHWDTKDQLNNYLHYLKSESTSNDKYFLIFLNKYGQAPQLGHSIDLVRYNEECAANRFLTLSYVYSIYRWLCDCDKQIHAPILKNTIFQYNQIIKSL